MNNNEYYLVTDGSSLIYKDYYESSSAGALYFDGQKLFGYGKYHTGGTNSIGELYAVFLGLQICSYLISNGYIENRKINVISDSEYVVKSMNSYILKWSKRGRNADWTKSDGSEVKYQDIFKTIWYDYINNPNLDISIYHIRGHIRSNSANIKYKKFMKSNNVSLEFAQFMRLVGYNHRVDELANDVRKSKSDQYFGACEKEVLEWGRNTNQINPKRRNLILHAINPNYTGRDVI